MKLFDEETPGIFEWRDQGNRQSVPGYDLLNTARSLISKTYM
ncbi:MAG TPA: hypothetical protein PLV96_08325 [Methanoregulaceae archaeon]|nr:hypothetical protein [Methanoregulaceae archaeon]HQA80783.1 hypothetical protein [Methanoregulaceae archaeon]